MEDIKLLVPRDKFDTASAERLMGLNPSSLAPILPLLFEWIQDINWPIAPVIAKVLVASGKLIIPEIKKILASNDDDWKYACFILIIDHVSKDILEEIIPDLERVAFHASVIEKDLGLDSKAKAILKGIKAI